jgi:phage terminase large subunit GpA-like protein
VKGHAGFHLNALISLFPNASWVKLADEYLRAHKDPERLRVFKNTLLAEAWEDAADTIDDEMLYRRREAFGLGVDWSDEDGEIHRLDVPEEVLLITCGVDVQDDRVEATLIGWSDGGVAFVLGHFVFYGSPEEDGTWRELDEMLLSRWRHPLGGMIGITAACVDSGDGGWTDEVYAFCVPRLRRGVMAIKGMGGFSRPVIEASKGKIHGGTQSGRGTLWIVGSDAVKTQLMNRITRAPETLRFSWSLPRVWFEQFASERRVVRRIGGRPVRKYERIGAKAAEALDCSVYAFAAHAAIPLVDFDKIRARLRGEAQPVPAARPADRPRDFLGDTSNFLG